MSIKEKITTYIDDGKEKVVEFWDDSKSEMKETKEMVELMWDAKNRKLTEEEKKAIKEQGVDVFKVTILGGLFVIPFSGAFIFFLVKIFKKFGINILPSSFNKDKTHTYEKSNTKKL